MPRATPPAAGSIREACIEERVAASDPTEIPDGVPGERVDALYGLNPD